MKRVFLVVLVVAMAMTPPAAGVIAAEDHAGAPLDAAVIFDRMQQANARRAELLEAYSSTRRYSVFEPGHDTDAELVASMQFTAPSTKTFKVLDVHGVGWIHRRVFGRLMQAESEAAVGKDAADSAITSANYDVRLVGSDRLGDRDCYVLALEPRRHDKYLFVGQAWVDKQDFAIAKIEGEPAKSPSFWVLRAPFVRTYQRVGAFWLPREDETHSHIRFAGEYVLRIQYADYQITTKQ